MNYLEGPSRTEVVKRVKETLVELLISEGHKAVDTTRISIVFTKKDKSCWKIGLEATCCGVEYKLFMAEYINCLGITDDIIHIREYDFVSNATKRQKQKS